MKKLLAIFIVFTLCFAMGPHLSEAKGFRGGHSFTRDYSRPSHSTSLFSHRSPSVGRSLLTHGAAFGAGVLLGHMFHPFGGFYGGASYGFSFFGILIDVIAILLIISLLKNIFTRRS